MTNMHWATASSNFIFLCDATQYHDQICFIQFYLCVFQKQIFDGMESSMIPSAMLVLSSTEKEGNHQAILIFQAEEET